MKVPFTIYHAYPDGTGSALKMKIISASNNHSGGVEFSFAKQASKNSKKPLFEWSTGISLFLNPIDISRLMQVFRGELERVLIVLQDKYSLELTHEIKNYISTTNDEWYGYKLKFIPQQECQQQNSNIIEKKESQIMISSTESLCIQSALCSAFSEICFGI